MNFAAILLIWSFVPTPSSGTDHGPESDGPRLRIPPAPVLSSVVPAAIGIGVPQVILTITGTGFTNQSITEFDGDAVATTFVSVTEITALVPGTALNQAHSTSIRVRETTGGPLSNPLTFMISNPTLTAISPANALAGSLGLTLEVVGAFFHSGSVVLVSNAAVSTVFVDAAHLTATIPATQLQSTGNRTIRVDNLPGASGGLSGSQTLQVVASLLESLAPPSTVVGGAGFTLTATGTGFGPLSQISFDGVAVATNPVSSTTLTATIPATMIESLGIVDIFITGGGVGPSNVLPFTIGNPVPAITSLSPASFLVGSSGPATLTVNGSGFVPGSSSTETTVLWNGAPRSTNFINPGAVSIQVSSGDRATVGPVSIVTRNPAPGGGDSAPATLFISNPAPAISSVSPMTLIAGSPASNLTIFGSGIIASTTASLDGIPLFVQSTGSGNMVVQVTAALLMTARNAELAISNSAPGGGGTSDPFIVTVANPVATLTSLTPATWVAGSTGFPLAVYGSGFASGCVVKWNATSLTTNLVSAGHVVASVPISLIQSGGQPAITVENPAPGGGPSNALVLTVNNPIPVLNAVTPSILVASGSGATVVLTGLSFVPASEARWNGAPLVTNWIGSTSLSAFVPGILLASAGSAEVTVHSPAPQGGLSLPRTVTIENPVPVLTQTTPMMVPAGSLVVVITATGTGFNPQSRLKLSTDAIPNGILFSPTSVAPTSLTVIVPGAYFPAPTAARCAIDNPPPGGGTSSILPFVFTVGGTPLVDTSPITFSVNGPVDPQTEGIAFSRGSGPSTPAGTRMPPVASAQGLATPKLGDVNDYRLLLPERAPSEAELFQSEPEAGGGRPAGTNNQILVAGALGLSAGYPGAMARDNVDGASFGEDHFGVTSVSLGGGVLQAGATTPWSVRTSIFVPNVVTGDAGTSFRFSVSPFSRGRPRTGVAIESLRIDTGSGTGPWGSPGGAAAEVFGTPLLTIPGAPAIGSNSLIHGRFKIGLADVVTGAVFVEDDLDALECSGANNPASWFGPLPALLGSGDLHARTTPVEPAHGLYAGLAPPSVPAHSIGFLGGVGAPVFFTVDRASTGAALSAVRTQWLSREAAADVFLAHGGSNYLLIDEQEAGLYGGVTGSIPCDNMDGLILHVHPDDRYYLLELVNYTLPFSPLVTTFDPDGIPGTGDEYRLGPGYSYSLVRFSNNLGRPLRIKLGFSVTTDSIGLERTPVDYETGLDPSGHMQQAGDVYFAQFGNFLDGLGVINPAPVTANGTHFRWYEESALGLEPGSWVLGSSANFGLLPDELDAIDSSPAAPGCPGLLGRYGSGCAGSGGFVPDLSATGCPSSGSTISFGISDGLGGATCLLAIAPWAIEGDLGGGCQLLVPLVPSLVALPGTLAGSGNGNGAFTWTFPLPPGIPPIELALQGAVFDPGSAQGVIATTNGLMIRVP